jgi:hypothetical protein
MDMIMPDLRVALRCRPPDTLLLRARCGSLLVPEDGDEAV